MATTGNFGQIKDMRAYNLSVGGKTVIDNSRNLKSIKNATVTDLKVRGNVNIDGIFGFLLKIRV